MAFFRSLGIILCALSLWTVAASCQSTGTIVGKVSDPSGASIPGSVVTATNAATGLDRSTAALEDGSYTLRVLPPGSYRVSATQPGFQTVTRTGVKVSIDESVRVDIELPVGEVSTDVTVSAAPPLVETTQASLGLTIDNRKIVDLPLNGRNFAQLGTLMPGVVAPPSGLGGASGNATPGGFGAATSGFSVNGQRNQSNNFLLDGATNNDTFNSGFVHRPPPDALQEFKILTHSYDAEYGRNAGSVVNVATRSGTNEWHGSAWEFFRNDALQARNFFSLDKPELQQNQFGGAAGGPVKRNKWFVFGYYEGFLNTEGTADQRVVLTEAQRAGDFSQNSPVIRDPATGQPYANNRIPTNRLDPVALALLDRFVPLPNFGANQFVRAPSLTDDRHQFGARSDLQASEKNALFARYLFSDISIGNPIAGSNFSPSGQNFESTLQDVMVSDIYTLSPTAINVARFNVNRIFAKPQTTSDIPAADLGFQTPNTQPSAVGVPFVSLAGFFSVGDGDQIFAERVNNAINFTDDLSVVAGPHSIKAGFNMLRETVKVAFLNRPNGDHTFSGVYTGSAAADFLLGQSVRYRQGGGDPIKEGTGSLYGLYVQDEFRAAPGLTLNFGVRWEIPIPFKEAEDRVNGWRPGARSTVFPDAPAGLLYPGDPGVPRGIINTDLNNFAPRLGAAYDVFGNGKTVVRGGWGMFYDTIPQQGDIFQNILAPPFNPLTQLDFGNNETTPRLANPLFSSPGGLVTTGFPTPLTFIGWDLSKEFRTPVVHHYDVTLQQQLPLDTAIEVAYVGARGKNLTGFLEDNVGIVNPGQTVRGARENPDFALVRPTYSEFESWYDSLQVSYRRRPTRGISFLTAYTWSHALDHVSGLNIGSAERPQDGRSLADIKGNAQFDVRHRVVFSYTWELPGFQDANAILRHTLGGWRFNGIVQAQSGFPFTVTEPQDIALRYQQNRPNAVCDPNSGAPHTVAQWFNTSCFERNTLPNDAGKFGTAGRNIVTGPGLFTTDLGLSKNIRIVEGHQLQFRAEAFNAWNQTNFESVVSNIGASNFGAVTSARNGRTYQFGFKYLF